MTDINEEYLANLIEMGIDPNIARQVVLWESIFYSLLVRVLGIETGEQSEFRSRSCFRFQWTQSRRSSFLTFVLFPICDLSRTIFSMKAIWPIKCYLSSMDLFEWVQVKWLHKSRIVPLIYTKNYSRINPNRFIIGMNLVRRRLSFVVDRQKNYSNFKLVWRAIHWLLRRLLKMPVEQRSLVGQWHVLVYSEKMKTSIQ